MSKPNFIRSDEVNELFNERTEAFNEKASAYVSVEDNYLEDYAEALITVGFLASQQGKSVLIANCDDEQFAFFLIGNLEAFLADAETWEKDDGSDDDTEEESEDD
jgi:hypothetical protein